MGDNEMNIVLQFKCLPGQKAAAVLNVVVHYYFQVIDSPDRLLTFLHTNTKHILSLLPYLAT